MNKYEVEELIDKKIKESRPEPMGCFSIVASIIFTVLGINLIVLPLILTAAGVYTELISKGFSVWQSLNYAIGWPIALVPIIVDYVIKSINP
jgi:hypothetical protein